MNRINSSLFYQLFTFALIVVFGSDNVIAQVPDSAKPVDLGLPSGTLWANMNLGAKGVTDYGDYYAWGETANREPGTFLEDNYKFFSHKDSTYVDDDGFSITETKKGYTKYVLESEASDYGLDGFFDNKGTLDKDDDAAQIVWGEKWQIPTKEQFLELRDSCTWTKAILNGIDGYKIIGPNGNYIFLPASGWCYENFKYVRKGELCCYWCSSRSIYEHEALGFEYLLRPNEGVGCFFYMGRTIRPVYTQKSHNYTGIKNIRTNKRENAKESWYNLNGSKLKYKPNTKGIYIHNGKKIINLN